MRRRGFSLIEAAFSVVLVAVMFAAVMTTVGAARVVRYKTDGRSRGSTLAHDLMAEILQVPYEEPDGPASLGRDGGEAGGNRIDFDDMPPLPADEGLCLVIKWAGGADGANVRYTTTAGNRIKTGDAGAFWQIAVDKSLLYEVRGTYKENVTVATTYFTGIRVMIRTGSDATTRVETTVPLLHVQDITP